MQLYKEKHDFIRIFLHKSRVVVGRGGFEALPTSTALYFKGIHDYAPTMPQAIFSFILYIFQYPKSKIIFTLSHTVHKSSVSHISAQVKSEIYQ